MLLSVLSFGALLFAPARYSVHAADIGVQPISGYGCYDANEEYIYYFYYGKVVGQYTAKFKIYSGNYSIYTDLPDPSDPFSFYTVPVGEFATPGQNAEFEDAIEVSLFHLGYGWYTAALVIIDNMGYEMAYCLTVASFYIPAPLEVELPPDPVMTGYTFVGWYYDEEFTEPVLNTDKLTSNTTVYAKMTEPENITFWQRAAAWFGSTTGVLTVCGTAGALVLGGIGYAVYKKKR
jgi:uncharacterized repeat protein (TIGR02543 family)